MKCSLKLFGIQQELKALLDKEKHNYGFIIQIALGTWPRIQLIRRNERLITNQG